MNTSHPHQRLHNRNELMQGPAPACLRVLRQLGAEALAYYPAGYHQSLLAPVLAARHGVAVEQIMLRPGIEGILQTLFDWLRPEDTALAEARHFAYYHIGLAQKGVTLRTFAMAEQGESFRHDIADALNQLSLHRPRLLLLASPNNPTGTVMPLAELQTLLAAAPLSTLVLLDEAYWGFDSNYDERAIFSLLERHPNLMIARTFSKYFGLAGLRLGYAVCGSAVMGMLRYRAPYLGVCRVAEEVALAALNSPDYYARTGRAVMAERERMYRQLGRLPGVKVFTSRANLLTIWLNPELEARLLATLPELEVLTLRQEQAGYWRISVGTRPVNSALLALLQRLSATAGVTLEQKPAKTYKPGARKSGRVVEGARLESV